MSDLIHKLEKACEGCGAALVCMTERRPGERKRCQRCGMMFVYIYFPGKNTTIAVTVRCPIPELAVDRHLPRWDPPNDYLLCYACAKTLEQRSGGIAQWKVNGRPKTCDFEKNVAKSLATGPIHSHKNRTS